MGALRIIWQCDPAHGKGSLSAIIFYKHLQRGGVPAADGKLAAPSAYGRPLVRVLALSEKASEREEASWPRCLWPSLSPPFGHRFVLPASGAEATVPARNHRKGIKQPRPVSTPVGLPLSTPRSPGRWTMGSRLC